MGFRFQGLGLKRPVERLEAGLRGGGLQFRGWMVEGFGCRVHTHPERGKSGQADDALRHRRVHKAARRHPSTHFPSSHAASFFLHRALSDGWRLPERNPFPLAPVPQKRRSAKRCGQFPSCVSHSREDFDAGLRERASGPLPLSLTSPALSLGSSPNSYFKLNSRS